MGVKKNLVLFSLIAMNLVDQPAPRVRIEQGIVSGKTSADGSFFEYLGIPYGTVNSSNRFLGPLPPPIWDGEYKAVDEHHTCLQDSYIGVVGSEDCLKINVYVPAFVTKPLPVMVYIHGGAFIFGSGGKLLYAPDFLVNHNVIVVTFNYRLGVLGFLCLQTKEVPGNAGMKDQIEALRWVQKNIAAFGGDPGNVTLFGESAGGTSTSLIIASKATDGLFHRAIMQSGTAITNWSINRKPIWIASLVAKSFGFKTKNPAELFKIFSNISNEDLVLAETRKPLELYLDTELLHLPCIEKKFPGIEVALDDLPYNLLKNHPKNISVINGSNSKEGLFLIKSNFNETAHDRNGKYLFASDLEFKSKEEEINVTRKIHEFYFGNERISGKHVTHATDFLTDLYFEAPIILESELLLKTRKAKVYNYFFNYSGERNILKQILGYTDVAGAVHADDILYLFKGRLWPFAINRNDQRVIDWMTKLWTNFAKYGDPTPDDTLPIKWTPSSLEDLRFLNIDSELKMGPIPNPARYQLWKELYEKYRKKTNFLSYIWHFLFYYLLHFYREVVSASNNQVKRA